MEIQKINETIRSQEADYNEIKQIYTNIKKDSAVRKTERYIGERKTRLTEIFTRTTTNHILLEDQEVLANHKYITANYYDSIKTLFTQAMEHLDKCEIRNQYLSQLYEPEDIEPQENNIVSSPKLFIQLFRINQIQKKLQAATQSISETKPNWYWESILTSMQKQWQEIEETHLLILMEDSMFEHTYFKDNMFENTQTEVEKVIEQLLSRITKGITTTNHKVKLPKIVIPTFTGSYESWSSFYDLFLKIIHEDTSLSDTEKMQYLKTHVLGDAAKLIKHLTVCDANYTTAWSLLTKRYKNERIIVNKHIDNILNIPKIKKGYSENLRNLHDTINENLQALKGQDIDISTWDPILTRILSRIWDPETDEKYEHQLSEPNKPQSFSEMMQFLEKRFKCLETTNSNKDEKASYKPPRYEFSVTTKHSGRCWYCHSNNHTVYQCTKFKELPIPDRVKAVHDKRMCRNCLMHESTLTCHSTKECGYCGKKGHHSYLHQESPYKSQYTKSNKNPSGSKNVGSPTNSTNTPKTVANNMSATTNTNLPKTTLLATAIVRVKAIDGTPHLLRALCDQGSEASFCTEELAQLLAYPRSKIQAEIIGIADEKPKTSNYSIDIQLEPRFPSEYKLPVTLIILPKLTGALPNKNVPQLEATYLENKMVADPTYYKKGPIDIILGAQEYSKLLLSGLEKIQNGIIAQDTQFGWILSGICCTKTTNTMKIINMMTRTTETQNLNKFWELEEVTENYQLSHDDQACENNYQNTTVRNPDGTYTVRLPFKNPDIDYGNSRQKAAARLLQLERKFAKDEKLKQRYQEFLNEYLEMGHMRKVNKPDYYQGNYYIPHQPVIKEDSLTTKLRVVFDASSKSNTNISLNDNMYTGPRLQQDLAAILLRWRKHKIAFMADIEKMYRAIKVNEQELKYQRILWRDSPKQPIHEYELTTVTYGTASAPYLAIKTLQQLAIDEETTYPRASQVALRDFYVDDILSGESTIENAKKLQIDLIKMLRAGGFNLRKWSSNNAELLQNVPNENKDDKMLKIPLDETRKSLGVSWTPLEDTFCFQITVNKKINPTKRFILSEVAKVFDPLGWLAPVIIVMKLIIQELWIDGTEWDQPVDESINKRWTEIQDQLKTIENISIPRWCQYNPESKVELHGFSDASEKAYGAVIYCRVQVNEGTYKVALLQAKSKVAPKQQKTTLPKLELCAALLLAQLMDKVIKTMMFTNPNIYCWTDSMITLGWIKGEAERWKTFVANRVSEIQKLLPQAKWNHVVSAQNPADVISRGIAPNKLEYLDIWWSGPEWLKNNDIPITKTIPEICEEIKRSFHININIEPQNKIWERFSSFLKMIRVLSYCLRFRNKTKNQEPLNCDEIQRTTTQILRLVQQEVFKEEYEAIKDGLSLKKGNKLASLDPFIDAEGLLRVGGRLQNSYLTYDQKHPIIIPHDHHITTTIVHDAHLKTLHGGNSLILSYIRQKYWILGGKRIVKKYITRCVKCIRYRAAARQQKMGTLPRARVTESFPFSHTGVDYAGPIQVRAMKGRGHKSYKGYIAVFVCLATKAIHLELVGDLSTESFIKQIQRMKKDFWKSWTKDYLHQLQQRYKWKTEKENLTVGTLVLIKDENITPSKWPLAKVKEIHPGDDGLTRVVTLQKATGSTLKRSIHTLVPLPVKSTTTEDDNEPATTIQSNTVNLRNTKPKAPKFTKWSKLLMILLVMLQIFGTATSKYTLKSVQPGFYVEQIGTVGVDRGVFRIETMFTREHIIQDLVKIKSVTLQFDKLCDKSKKYVKETHCRQFYHYLKEEETKFERTKEYLTDINKTRKKRGILGQLLTSVFGVNDEAYRDIDSLNKNQEKLIEASNHQTKLMLSTVSQVNKTEMSITQKLEKFHTKLNQVIDYIHEKINGNTEIDNNRANIKIMETYQLADKYIQGIIDYYTGLLEIYLSKATVYSVLTPKNISDIIASANKKLPNNLKIVREQLLDTKIAENDTHIQVYAYFPIQDTTKYVLMHVTAIPAKNSDQSFQTIEIQKAYIGLDYNNELYFELDHEEFISCLKRYSHFICFPSAVKNMQLNQNCIVDQLFKNQTQTKCHTKAVHILNSILWKQLYIPNTWLFMAKDHVTTSVICDGQREEVELRDVGVIRIDDNCMLKTANTIIYAKRTISVQVAIASYSKPINFTLNTYNFTRTIFNITRDEVVDSSDDILDHVTNSERSLQTELDNTVWRQITTHTYTVSILSALILLVLVILIFCYGPQMGRWLGALMQRKCTATAKQSAGQPTEGNINPVALQSCAQTSEQRQKIAIRNDPVYSIPSTKPHKPRSKHVNQRPAMLSESIELYQLESLP